MTYKIHSSKYFGVKPKPVAKEFVGLDKQMQIGYGLLNNNIEKKAINAWAKTLEEIKSYMELNNIVSLDKFDKIFNGNENVENWIQDYEMVLGDVIGQSMGKDKETYAKQLIELLEFIIQVTKKDDLLNLSSQRFIAEAHYSLRDVEKGEEAYLNLINTNPNYVWGYVGYSDEYWLNHKEDKNYQKAKSILSQALENENLEDREIAEERLEDLNREIKKQ